MLNPPLSSAPPDQPVTPASLPLSSAPPDQPVTPASLPLSSATSASLPLSNASSDQTIQSHNIIVIDPEPDPEPNSYPLECRETSPSPVLNKAMVRKQLKSNANADNNVY